MHKPRHVKGTQRPAGSTESHCHPGSTRSFFGTQPTHSADEWSLMVDSWPARIDLFAQASLRYSLKTTGLGGEGREGKVKERLLYVKRFPEGMNIFVSDNIRATVRKETPIHNLFMLFSALVAQNTPETDIKSCNQELAFKH